MRFFFLSVYIYIYIYIYIPRILEIETLYFNLFPIIKSNIIKSSLTILYHIVFFSTPTKVVSRCIQDVCWSPFVEMSRVRTADPLISTTQLWFIHRYHVPSKLSIHQRYTIRNHSLGDCWVWHNLYIEPNNHNKLYWKVSWILVKCNVKNIRHN